MARTTAGLIVQLKHSLHKQPFLAGLGLRQRFLKRAHESLPLLHLWIELVGFGFGFEREGLVYLHDHEHARSKQINFHVLDPGVPDTPRNFRPYLFVITLVLGDQGGIVFQVEREAAASCHSISATGIASSEFAFATVASRYPHMAK